MGPLPSPTPTQIGVAGLDSYASALRPPSSMSRHCRAHIPATITGNNCRRIRTPPRLRLLELPVKLRRHPLGLDPPSLVALLQLPHPNTPRHGTFLSSGFWSNGGCFLSALFLTIFLHSFSSLLNATLPDSLFFLRSLQLRLKKIQISDQDYSSKITTYPKSSPNVTTVIIPNIQTPTLAAPPLTVASTSPSYLSSSSCPPSLSSPSPPTFSSPSFSC